LYFSVIIFSALMKPGVSAAIKAASPSSLAFSNLSAAADSSVSPMYASALFMPWTVVLKASPLASRSNMSSAFFISCMTANAISSLCIFASFSSFQ
jgi:hypothetical protein